MAEVAFFGEKGLVPLNWVWRNTRTVPRTRAKYLAVIMSGFIDLRQMYWSLLGSPSWKSSGKSSPSAIESLRFRLSPMRLGDVEPL